MINTIVMLDEIDYIPCDVEPFLYESIEKRGIAIPVKVRVLENGYECVDGHKRLTVCNKLSKKDAKFLRIPVMLVNDFSKAGSGYWGNTQNKH